MMKILTKAALAATVATGLFAAPAFAASAGTSSFKANAVIVKPVTMTKVTNLNFGTTTMNPTLTSAGATVTVGDATGATAVCSSTQLTCSGGFPASFNLTSGVAGQTVQVTFDTPPTVLTHTVDTTKTVAFNLNNPIEAVQLDSSGAGTFNIGGEITVVAATVDGAYSATVNVVANYL
jgi:hypothetical protein